MNSKEVQTLLRRMAKGRKTGKVSRFFKTGKGEYAEADRFLEISAPEIRSVAKQYKSLAIEDIQRLLRSTYNEERQVALTILSARYQKGDKAQKAKIYNFYLKQRRFVNNWNLVDSSAHLIVGEHLFERDRRVLYTLGRSKSLWDRRIAIVSTLSFIRKGDFGDTLRLSQLLLSDEQDLIHKACGWMLREVGKREVETLERFLKIHFKKMPRTMLRYSIERLPDSRKKYYMKN